MEAEVRDILAKAVNASDCVETNAIKGRFDHLRGITKGRFSTDEVMQITRGE